MKDERTFVHWVELPESQAVRFHDLGGLIAGALHSDPFAQAAAKINLESELRGLVDSGELMVRDPLTLKRHTFPLEAVLRRALLLPNEDLRPLLESRGIGLRLTLYGTGPTHWTIEHAAAAIATQEGWHQGARDTLRQQMMLAAQDGTLTVRHPHTGKAYRPDPVCDFYELLTPADVNAWLARDPALSLRWIQAPAAAEPVTAARMKGDDEWRELARDEARRIIKVHAAKDSFPSQETIADLIAADFRKRKPPIHGSDGKPLSGATIKRHALKNISSATKRARAMNVRRGK